MKTRCVLMLASLLLGGCLGPKQAPANPEPVVPAALKHGEVAVIREIEGLRGAWTDDLQYEAIRDAAAWEARFVDPVEPVETPAVDFSQEMVLVGYRGHYYTHAVIGAAEIRDGRLHVAVRVVGSALPVNWFGARVVPRFEGEVVFDVDQP